MGLLKKISRWVENDFITNTQGIKISEFEDSRIKAQLKKIAWFTSTLASLLGASLMRWSSLQIDLHTLWIFSDVLILLLLFIAATFKAIQLWPPRAESRKIVFLSLGIGLGSAIFLAFLKPRLQLGTVIDLAVLLLITILIGRKRYRTSFAVSILYLFMAFYIDDALRTVTSIRLNPLPALVPALVIFVVYLFKKIKSSIHRFFKTKFGAYLRALFVLLKKSLRKSMGYIGPYRKKLAWCFVGLAFLTWTRKALPPIDELLLDSKTMYWISGIGVVIVILSLLLKERPLFSVAFTLLGWPLIVVLLVNHFESLYQPGNLTFSALFLITSAIFTRRTLNRIEIEKSQSVSTVMGLGPVGFITAALLLALI